MSTGRDYRKLTTPRNRSSLSGGAGLVIGLALGGLLAYFTYQQGKKVGAAAGAETHTPKPASQQAAEAAADVPPVDTIDYTFYGRLPNQGVDVSKNKEATPSAAQLDQLLAQVAACTTRGHRIHLKVAHGHVTRAGAHLHYSAAPAG